MHNRLNVPDDCWQLQIFSFRRPVVSLVRIALIGIFFVISVFGTYGTMRGGIDVSGQRYLQLAYPAAVALFFTMLLWRWLVTSVLRIYVFRYPEGILLVAFYATSFISLLGAPNKILGTGIAALGAIVTMLAINNHVITREQFLVAVRLLCLYIWLTAVLAFVAGAQSFYVGAFTVGPIYIEYNTIFWRVNSWFISSTAFGVFQAYGILAALYLIWVSRQFWFRALTLASIPAFILGMSLSGARTAFVVLVLALLTLALARFSLRRSYLASLMAVFVVLAFMMYFLAPYWEDVYILRRFFLDGSDTADLGGRGGMWANTVFVFFSLNPFQILFGGGLGTFQELLNSPIGAHSGLLRILVEHGVVGLGVFIGMMTLLSWKLFIVVRCQKKPTPEQQLFLMFVILFFSGELVIQQLMGISIDTLIFFAFFGLILAERKLRFIERNRSHYH